MTDCDAMRDLMPEVVRGSSTWSAAEAQHFAQCAECAAEWRVVRAGAELHANLVVSADRIADAVMKRLHETPIEAVVVRQLPWRGAVIGLLAAAASIAIVLVAPLSRNAQLAGIPAVTQAVVPELHDLSENELEQVLTSVQPTELAANFGVQPHFDELTDAELAQLLNSGEDL